MEETRIIFVCLGNQCRSPMAEFYLKSKMKRSIVNVYASVTSAGVLEGVEGYPIFAPAKWELEKNGLMCDDHYSRNLSEDDYDNFEYIICLDKDVRKSVKDIFGGDPLGKTRLLLDFTPDRKGEDIADPMVTGDYAKAFKDIAYGCDCLYTILEDKYINLPEIQGFVIKGEKAEVVTEQTTSKMIGIGSFEVYSTSCMIRLMEQAAWDSMETRLEDGLTTIGTRIDVKHLKASPLGAHIRAEASLIRGQ